MSRGERKYAWSWADYERELEKDKRRADRAAAKEKRQAEKAAARDTHSERRTPARARPSLLKGDRCEGEAPAGTSGADVGAMDDPANASQARPTFSPPTPAVHEADPPTPAPAPSMRLVEIDTSTAAASVSQAVLGYGATFEARKAGKLVWCDQCDCLVSADRATSCASKFCSLRKAAAA